MRGGILSALHSAAVNSIAVQPTKPQVAQSVWRVKEIVSRLRRHPFARGRCASLHWRFNALPHTPEASSPDKFPFRRLSFHCVAGVSNPFRAMPTQRPTHIDSTPTPDPDVRTAEALTPFQLSVNRYNYSEQPTAHGTEGSDIVAVQAQQQSPVAPQVTRHPSVQFAPSAFRSFDPAPPLRTASSLPNIANVYPLYSI